MKQNPVVNAITMHLISLWALVVVVVCQHKRRVYAYYIPMPCPISGCQHEVLECAIGKKWAVPHQYVYNSNSTIHIQWISVMPRTIKHARITQKF